MKNHDGRFGVDRDVDRLQFGVETLAGFRVQFDESDVAEVGAVSEPQRFRSSGREARQDRSRCCPRRRRTRRSDRHPPTCSPAILDRGSFRSAGRSPTWVGSRGGVVEEVPVACTNDVRRPAVVAAACDHFWSRPSARHGLHDRSGAPPRPSVIGDEGGESVAGGVDVELSVGLRSRSMDRACRAGHRGRTPAPRAKGPRRRHTGVS